MNRFPSPKAPPRRLTLAVTVIAIALATLWPLSAARQSRSLCFFCGQLAGVDFLLNIVLFLPFGAAAFRWRSRIDVVILSGGLFSLIIEILQWRIITGRDASTADLLANTVGCAFGALLAQSASTLFHPVGGMAQRLWTAWSAGIVLIAASATWILAPARVQYVYWSQWAPLRRGYAPFEGELHSLALFGKDIPNGTLIDPTNRPQSYREGKLEVRARVVAGPPASSRTLIARVGNPLGEQFQLAQDGSSLVFRRQTNASRLRLRSPSMVFNAVLLEGVHDLDLAADRFRVRLRTNGASAGESTRRVTVGYLWQIVSPVEVWSGILHRTAAALLFLLLFLPLGYWERISRGRRHLRLSLGVAAVTFVAVPLLLGMPIAAWPELLGAIAGLAGGTALAGSVAGRL